MLLHHVKPCHSLSHVSFRMKRSLFRPNCLTISSPTGITLIGDSVASVRISIQSFSSLLSDCQKCTTAPVFLEFPSRIQAQRSKKHCSTTCITPSDTSSRSSRSKDIQVLRETVRCAFFSPLGPITLHPSVWYATLDVEACPWRE